MFFGRRYKLESFYILQKEISWTSFCVERPTKTKTRTVFKNTLLDTIVTKNKTATGFFFFCSAKRHLLAFALLVFDKRAF